MDPGYVFSPADQVLTDVYLSGEIAGRPVVSSYMHHADLYSVAPEDLVSDHVRVRDRDGNDACFLYTPVRYAGNKKTRKLRAIDGDPRKSYWHSESGKIPLEGSTTGGYVQDFTYAMKGTDGRVERLGWRMKEYGIVSKEYGDGDLVLCKIYRTPLKPSIASAPSATPAAVPVCDATVISKKRKAAEGDHHEDSTPSARPRLTEDQPSTADSAPTLEWLDDELFKMWHGVTGDKRIKALMPHAPDPMVDLDGYMDCFAELVQTIAAEETKVAQPEPERDGAAAPSSFFHSVEQEFSSLYRTNVSVTLPGILARDHMEVQRRGDAVAVISFISVTLFGGHVASVISLVIVPCSRAQSDDHVRDLGSFVATL